MKKQIVVLAIALPVFAGCSTLNRPLVDTKGVDQNKLAVDMRECQEYAKQVPGTGTGAAAGAGVGYALGYIIGRVAGVRDPSRIARSTAVMGTASGAAGGAVSERSVVQRCLAGRGYNVLN